MDDIKSSHADPKANDKFEKWCESKHGSDKIGHAKAHRGKVHDCLGMNLDCTRKGVLRVEMKKYINNVIKDYPCDIKSNKTIWNDNLFKIDNDSPPLSIEETETFHTFAMKGMFLVKRARPDLEPGIGFLSTRVRNPTEQDKNKLEKILGHLQFTKNDILTLEADKSATLYWYIDAAFAVHPDMKSHTGSTFTLGKGAISSSSTKQKVNSRSTTEAELIGVDDKIAKVIWTKKFIEEQGFEVKLNIIY